MPPSQRALKAGTISVGQLLALQGRLGNEGAEDFIRNTRLAEATPKKERSSGSAGITVSVISGPTKDILVGLLTPLTHLQGLGPNMESVKSILGEIRDNIVASLSNVAGPTSGNVPVGATAGGGQTVYVLVNSPEEAGLDPVELDRVLGDMYSQGQKRSGNRKSRRAR